MRILHAVSLIALLAGPACALMPASAAAQTPNVNLMPELKSKSPEEIEQDKVTEKAYKDSLRKIPDAKVSNDPWGSVRAADAPKSAPAKSKAKTGSVTN